MNFKRYITGNPLGILSLLWPSVLLAPVVPLLAKPTLGGFGWRQEIVIAALLVATFITVRLRLSGLGNSSRPVSKTQFLLLLPLGLFVLWSFVSLVWAQAPFSVLHYGFSWSLYLLFITVMLSIVQNPRLLNASLKSVAVVVLILSIVNALEFWSATQESFQHALIFRRLLGLGEPLAVVIPILTVLALHVRSSRLALLYGAAAVLAWLATLQTLERAPTVGAIAGLVLVLVGMLVKRAWRPRTRARAFMFIAAFLAVTAIQNLPLSGGNSSSLTRLQAGTNNDESTQVRFMVWAIGLEMLRAHPLTGVGANNFEIAYPEARAQFSARAVNSPYPGMYEELMVQRAHNEYIQILAELGVVGFALFLSFCMVLIWLAIRALRFARSPLAVGAVGSLATFAISSGASSVSFRWLGSGLLFFFAAAIVWRFSKSRTKQIRSLNLSPAFMRLTTAGGLAVALVLLCGAGILGINATLRGAALDQARKTSPEQGNHQTEPAEQLFRKALQWSPYDGATHFRFGLWLDGEKRSAEALKHLRFAVTHGFNSSPCYALLAAAEAKAGETQAAEQTLARAVQVYPRSVFLRVRHAIALAEIGKTEAGAREYATALSLDARAARGWRQLMVFGPEAAQAAAYVNNAIAPPKELYPTAWTSPAISEHAKRQPTAYPRDDFDLPSPPRS